MKGHTTDLLATHRRRKVTPKIVGRERSNLRSTEFKV